MNQRFYSLDVFRGATVALMIMVNNPGSWGHIYGPLAHAPWHGATPTDLVFPFFLFAVGNAMAFVMPKLQQAGNTVFLKKVLRRALLIFAIGLFLNWSPFVKWSGENLVLKYWTDPENPENGIRILGVLQRIAMSYLVAALIVYFFKLRGAFYTAFLLLIAYWLICMFAGMPGDPYSLPGYFGTSVDRSVLGVAHMYKGEGIPFDPEGLASTITSIVQVLFGYFVGNYIQVKGKTYEMLSNLFVAGCILAFTGLCWDLAFPINKKIWTSSFVLYTSGLATIVLSIFIYLIEFRKFTGAWSKFFDVFGKNPLFIFVLSGFLPRVLALLRWQDSIDPVTGKIKYTSALPWFYEQICKPVSENLKNGSLLYAVTMILLYWMIVYWMDKKRIYIKV